MKKLGMITDLDETARSIKFNKFSKKFGSAQFEEEPYALTCNQWMNQDNGNYLAFAIDEEENEYLLVFPGLRTDENPVSVRKI